MALPDWTVIGGIITAFGGSLVAMLRVRPEARKFRDEGAAQITTSAGAMIKGVESEMQELRTEVKEMRAWRKGLELRLLRHTRWHLRWDDIVLAYAREAGHNVPDPPRLDDEEEVRPA